MGNLVYLLLLLSVYGEFTEGNTEYTDDNLRMSEDENPAATTSPDTSVENYLPETQSTNFNLNITFVMTTNYSGKPDTIHMALVSTNKEAFDEIIKKTFLNLELNNDIPHGDLYKSYRPWFAGLGTTPPPRIKPGKPWPARPEDYANFSVTTHRNHGIVNSFQESTLQNVQTGQHSNHASNSSILSPNTNRPSFAGLGTTSPPKIKPGKPWPARPEDYADFSVTTHRNHDIVNRFQEVTTQNVGTGQNSDNTTNSIILSPNTNRPSFAGLGTTSPPKIKPGKPWPARPEDYANFSATTDKNKELEDIFQGSSAQIDQNLNNSLDSSISTPNSNRPSFAGLGTTSPPKIKPGKPWPARPEDYANFSVTTDKNKVFDDIFQGSSPQSGQIDQNLNNSLDSSISTPKSNRPSFAGLGTTSPPKIKPGKPWPARPEDYAEFSVTTNRNHEIVNRFQEVTTQNVETGQNSDNITNSSILSPNTNRPSFAGLRTTSPPKIKPGKPWPAIPEDYANFSATTDKNKNFEYTFQESTSQNVETDQSSNSNLDFSATTDKIQETKD